jgi:hypothetical protein
MPQFYATILCHNFMPQFYATILCHNFMPQFYTAIAAIAAIAAIVLTELDYFCDTVDNFCRLKNTALEQQFPKGEKIEKSEIVK